MPAQEVVSLHNLPSDVIRKIIDVGVDSIDAMKLITPRWNRMAREHLSNRDRMPAITECICDCSELASIKLSITYPYELKNYFGMLNKTSAIKRGSNDCCEFNVSARNMGFLSRVFDRCSSIDLLTVKIGCEESFRLIKGLIGTLKIEELRFTGGRRFIENADEIVNFVKDNTVNLLRLSTFGVGFVKESKNFFVDVSSSVSKIQFVKEEYVKPAAEMVRVWADWTEATKWLNKRRAITATLDEDPEGNGKFSRMCITIERKADNGMQHVDYYPVDLMC